MHDIESRLTALEKSLRRWRAGACVAGVALAAALLIGAQRQAAPRQPGSETPVSRTEFSALSKRVDDLSDRLAKIEGAPVVRGGAGKDARAIADGIKNGVPVIGMTRDEATKALGKLAARTTLQTATREVVQWGTVRDPKREPDGPLVEVYYTTTFEDGRLVLIQTHPPRD